MPKTKPMTQMTITIKAEVPRDAAGWRGWDHIMASVGGHVRTQFGVTARNTTTAEHARALGLDAETLKRISANQKRVHPDENYMTCAQIARDKTTLNDTATLVAESEDA